MKEKRRKKNRRRSVFHDLQGPPIYFFLLETYAEEKLASSSPDCMPALYVVWCYAIFCVFEKSSCHSPESEHVYIKFSPTFDGRAERNCTMYEVSTTICHIQFLHLLLFTFTLIKLSIQLQFSLTFFSAFKLKQTDFESNECRLMSNKLIAEQSHRLDYFPVVWRMNHEIHFFPLSYISLQSFVCQFARVFSALLMYSINEKSFIKANISQWWWKLLAFD